MGILCSTSHSNQASTEYVKASIDALRQELSTSIVNMQSQVNQLPLITPHLGEKYQGGIVFWVDASKQHGLVVSLQDLDNSGVSWLNGEGGERTVNAKGKGLGAGETNTRLIVAEQTIDDQNGQFAALIATHYQVQSDGITPCTEIMTKESICYGGWYLPSLYELFLLKSEVGLQQGLYWSSTEANETEA